jgi:hypothetical protein
MNNDLTKFGFVKVGFNNSQVDGYDEKTLHRYRQNYIEFLKSKNASEKDIKAEEKVGWFWVPNPLHEDKEITSRKCA